MATVIRYEGKETADFRDAFSAVLSSDYQPFEGDVTFAATGPVGAEAMRALWILREEFNVRAQVLNISTIKPLDSAALVRAAQDTSVLISVEEHQKGGLGNLVSSALLESGVLRGKGIFFDMMGIEDRFGTSGKPWELMSYFGLSAESIVQRALKMLKSDNE
jgi:transketolase